MSGPRSVLNLDCCGLWQGPVVYSSCGPMYWGAWWGPAAYQMVLKALQLQLYSSYNCAAVHQHFNITTAEQ